MKQRPGAGRGEVPEAQGAGNTGLRGPNAVTGLRGPNAVTGLRGPNAVTGLRGPNAVTGLRGPNAVAPAASETSVPEAGDSGIAHPESWSQRLRRLSRAITREAAVVTSPVGSSPATPTEAEIAGVPLGPKGELYRTFGNAFSRAFELAVTPALFGAMGYGLDRWLGIVPVLTTICVLLAIVGMLLRTWYGYVHHMESLEAAAPWARRRPVP